MSHSVLRYRIPFLFGCLPLLSLSAQQKRAFEPGGPVSLVLAGWITQTRPEVQVTKTNLSFTMDRNGRLIDTGGNVVETDTVDVELYEVQLFVDEAAVREALRRFAGEDFFRLQDQGKIQEVVRRGAFPKLLLLRFSEPQKARGIRENLAGELRKYPGGSGAEAGRFTSYLHQDFVEGDVVEIRIAPDGTVRTTVTGTAQQEIISPKFADAILSVWLMNATYYVSAEDCALIFGPDRLISDCNTMVSYLQAFVPPKPGW